ncbi:MAG: hypothetical protein H0X51_03100 [Parachlamydiaceae bacterium]|nr:hypothetical protein [Parachlamydiaceae bacterium]
MFLILLITLLSISPLAHSVQNLAFHRLEGLPDHLSREAATQHLQREMIRYHDHEIQIQGFLYQNPQEQWILASEPNLKTCCIGSTSKISQQLFISNPLQNPSTTSTNTVQGHFLVSPKWDSNGNLTQLYTIQQATILPKSTPLIPIALSGIFLAGSLWIFLLMRKQPIVPK